MKRWLLAVIVLIAGVVLATHTKPLEKQLSPSRADQPTRHLTQQADDESLEERTEDQYTYRFIDLGLSFTYPKEWGAPGSTLKNNVSLDCAYIATFWNNPFITMCASSPIEIGRCQADLACGSSGELKEWRDYSLGGHLKTGHRWSLQNRPMESGRD